MLDLLSWTTLLSSLSIPINKLLFLLTFISALLLLLSASLRPVLIPSPLPYRIFCYEIGFCLRLRCKDETISRNIFYRLHCASDGYLIPSEIPLRLYFSSSIPVIAAFSSVYMPSNTVLMSASRLPGKNNSVPPPVIFLSLIRNDWFSLPIRGKNRSSPVRFVSRYSNSVICLFFPNSHYIKTPFHLYLLFSLLLTVLWDV